MMLREVDVRCSVRGPLQGLGRVLTNISRFPGSGVGQNSFAPVLTGPGSLSISLHGSSSLAR